MVESRSQFSCNSHATLPVHDQSGRAYCFNCVIEEFQTPAYNLARRMLDDWALAEDATQESFVAGYRAFAQFRGDNLKSWMMRIVANTCRDFLRSRKARPAVSLNPVADAADDDPDPTMSVADLPGSGESPEAYAERQELSRVIEKGLKSLNEEQRLAVLLVDVQGFSYEEAAASMNCSLGTVKSRVSRGRKGLRDYLQQFGELLPAQFRHNE